MTDANDAAKGAGAHEFSARDGEEFAALCVWLSRCKGLLYALAALFVVLAFEGLATLRALGPSASILGVLAGAALTVAVIAAVVARWISRASTHCGAVASTAGQDLAHAVDALRAVRAVLTILRGATVAVVLLVVVAFAARLARM